MDALTVPYTLEGSYVLHQMVGVRWEAWNALDAMAQERLLADTVPLLTPLEGAGSALFSMLGHKGDLMFVHFRKSMDELNQAELKLTVLPVWPYLEVRTSYLSVVELGLYESTQRIYRVFEERGLTPGTPEWDEALAEEMQRQQAAMAPRLFPEMPGHRYVCFYPMDRRRGEEKNWYQVPFADRSRMMHEHGMVGRKYAGVVRQIISGSIGFDDWEWGVTLFSEDPLQFKKLIYEMRFDEVSAVYALFGKFYFGIRVAMGDLAAILVDHRIPSRD